MANSGIGASHNIVYGPAAVVAALLVFGIWRYGRLAHNDNRDHRIARLIGFALGSLGVLLCFVIAAVQDSDADILIAVVLLGGTFGWIVGILLTPTDQVQVVRFNEYLKGVSVFFTGFLAAKLDPIWPYVTNPSKWTFSAGLGVALFLAMLGLGWLFTFIGRLDATRDGKIAKDATRESEAVGASSGASYPELEALYAKVGRFILEIAAKK